MSEIKKTIEVLKHRLKIRRMTLGAPIEDIEALSQILTLLKEYQSIKGVVPSTQGYKDAYFEQTNPVPTPEDCEQFNKAIDSYQEEVKLGIVKFKERLKKKDFENFLMEEHASSYVGTDDMMIDDFNDWVQDLGVDELIEYGNKYTKAISTELERGEGYEP